MRTIEQTGEYLKKAYLNKIKVAVTDVPYAPFYVKDCMEKMFGDNNYVWVEHDNRVNILGPKEHVRITNGKTMFKTGIESLAYFHGEDRENGEVDRDIVYLSDTLMIEIVDVNKDAVMLEISKISISKIREGF